MSDTKKRYDQPREKHRTHEKRRRCEFCGEWFPPDEIVQDRDEKGQPKGWFCEGCI